MRKNILFVTVLVLLLFLAQELVFRVVFPIAEVQNFNRAAYSQVLASLKDPTPEPSLSNASFRWASSPDGVECVHRLNLYGFRSDQWSLKRKPEHAGRLMVVGDSFVEGFMAESHATIPAILQQAIRNRGLEWEVMNLGIGGAGIQEYARLIRDAVTVFDPDEVLLAIFANDLPSAIWDQGWLEGAIKPMTVPAWQPRALMILPQFCRTRQVPTRWHRQPFDFVRPVPDPANPWSTKEFDHYWTPRIDASIRQAMREAKFNPFMVDNHQVMKNQLVAPANLQPGLRAISQYLANRNIGFCVVYLPDKTQVSDAYLPYYAQFGANKEPDSLMGLEYQGHARMLTRACSELGIPFLDLTKKITDQEARGCRLYWNYDSHLNAAGYQLCAQTIFDWWLPRHSENIR